MIQVNQVETSITFDQPEGLQFCATSGPGVLNSAVKSFLKIFEKYEGRHFQKTSAPREYLYLALGIPKVLYMVQPVDKIIMLKTYYVINLKYKNAGSLLYFC